MKVLDKVIDVLEQGNIEENKYYLPSIQLDRALYMKVNKVLENLGGKWNRKEKAHLFVDNIEDKLDTVILTREITDIKKELQYFSTPKNIIKKLIEYVDINPEDRILEPSAGEGAITKELLKITSSVDACEIHNEFQNKLKEQGVNVVGSNFLEYNPEIKYSKIVANPPFTRQQDIDHVNHMLDICNGRVVSVMMSSILWRENKKAVDFRNRIEELGGEFIELPLESFKESGTKVGTCIVVVDI